MGLNTLIKVKRYFSSYLNHAPHKLFCPGLKQLCVVTILLPFVCSHSATWLLLLLQVCNCHLKTNIDLCSMKYNLDNAQGLPLHALVRLEIMELNPHLEEYLYFFPNMKVGDHDTSTYSVFPKPKHLCHTMKYTQDN